MPKTIANFQCKLCGDIFTATSDEFASCKCGMSEVKPSEISSEYKGEKGVNFERLRDGNDHTYYNENDIYIMNNEILELYNQVKQLCTELDFSIYESYKYDELGNEYLNYINFETFEFAQRNHRVNNEAGNTIKFKARLDKPFNEDNFKVRLLEFKNFLLKIKNKEVDISNREQLVSDELDLEWDRRQLELYDYTFYF